MKQQAKQLMKHPLISASFIFVLGNFFANIFNFLFNVIMANMLSQADYGTLSSINAIIALPTIAANSMAPIIIIFAGAYFAQQKLDMIRGLYIKITKFFIAVTLILCTAFFILIPQINGFFNINNNYILILTDLTILFGLMTAVNNSFLQAKLSFKFLVLIACSASILKVIFGWIFVSAGYSVNGAVAAIFVGTLIPYIISFLPLRFIFNGKINSTFKIDTKTLLAYGIPAALIALGINSFITNDIILVKHYFSPDVAGLYAQLSLIGRIIFFISAPIGNVMFPIIVQQHAKKENFTKTFLLAALLILIPSIAITIFYTLFPKFSILFVVKKPEALAAIPYLTLFSIYITIYSLTAIITSFYLSIKKTKIVIPVVATALLQILLIIIYHQNLWQIINISLSMSTLLLFTLLAYYAYTFKKNKNN